MTDPKRPKLVKLAFETTSLRIAFDEIELLRTVSPAIRRSKKYGQIIASIREVGIKPL